MKFFLQATKLGKVFLLCIFMIGLLSTEMAAQGNAQATMRISLKVINSPNFDLDTPKNLLTANRNALDEGTIRMDRTGLHQFNLPKNIKFDDSVDGKIELDFKRHIEQSDPVSNNFYLVVDFIEQIKDNKQMRQINISVNYL